MAVLYSNLFAFWMDMWAFFWKCSWVLLCFDVRWSWWRKLCMACLCFVPLPATSGLCAASKKMRLHEHELRTWIKRMNMPENAWNDDRHFLRTPLESAFAFQWEDAKWPPQSDESYILFVHVCCVIPFLSHSILEMAVLYSNLFAFWIAMWAFFGKCPWVLWCFDVRWHGEESCAWLAGKKTSFTTSGFHATRTFWYGLKMRQDAYKTHEHAWKCLKLKWWSSLS